MLIEIVYVKEVSLNKMFTRLSNALFRIIEVHNIADVSVCSEFFYRLRSTQASFLQRFTASEKSHNPNAKKSSKTNNANHLDAMHAILINLINKTLKQQRVRHFLFMNSYLLT